MKDTKPYHTMTVQEYAATEHSRIVPRWSILAVDPETYTISQLCRLGREALDGLAFFWNVNTAGSKQEVGERIIARVKLRKMLAQETEASLSSRSRPELRQIAEQAGVYHGWLSRPHLAACLLAWVKEQRQRSQFELARAKHGQLVQQAVHKGLPVSAEVLAYYGLNANGEQEPMMFGVPVSEAMKMAPELVRAAKHKSVTDFLQWVEAHPQESGRVAFIRPGILARRRSPVLEAGSTRFFRT
jgi:hypothetical protein